MSKSPQQKPRKGYELAYDYAFWERQYREVLKLFRDTRGQEMIDAVLKRPRKKR